MNDWKCKKCKEIDLTLIEKLCPKCFYKEHKSKISLEEDICPLCGKQTKQKRHNSDHSLCGGTDTWWTEICSYCGIYDVEELRNEFIDIRKKLKKKEKRSKKLAYYNEYYKENK